MKKYFLTMAVIALFAIGFAASDEEESANNESSAPKTEQKQETQEEKQAREKKEQADQKEKMKKDLLEHARYWANSFSSSMGPNTSRSYRDGKCKERFMDKIPNPTTDEDFELYKEFKQVWDEEWDKVQDAKKRMDNM